MFILYFFVIYTSNQVSYCKEQHIFFSFKLNPWSSVIWEILNQGFRVKLFLDFKLFIITASRIVGCNLRLTQMNLSLTYNMLTKRSSPLSVNWICFWITSCLPSFCYEDMKFVRGLNKCIISQLVWKKVSITQI